MWQHTRWADLKLRIGESTTVWRLWIAKMRMKTQHSFIASLYRWRIMGLTKASKSKFANGLLNVWIGFRPKWILILNKNTDFSLKLNVDYAEICHLPSSFQNSVLYSQTSLWGRTTFSKVKCKFPHHYSCLYRHSIALSVMSREK